MTGKKKAQGGIVFPIIGICSEIFLLKYFYEKSNFIFIFFLNLNQSYAFYCSEPYPPSAPSTIMKPTKPSKPFVPFCVNEIMGTHNCDSYTINSYNNDIDMYNSSLRSYKWDIQNYMQDLKDYVSEAEMYLNNVVEYAKCEANSLD